MGRIRKILVSQPEPENNKSPYFDLASKHNLKVDFRPFIHVEGVTARDFRQEKVDLGEPVSYPEVETIMVTRCTQCHSTEPTDDIWKTAPNGVMFDTPEQVKNMTDKIMTRAVRSNSMPQGNKTNMTDEERQVLKRWILQGAKITE